MGRKKPCKIVKSRAGLCGITVREFESKTKAKEWKRKHQAPKGYFYQIREKQ